MVDRGELTDAQWELIQPLRPRQRPRTGRPALDNRLIINAMLWLTRTGAPWRDLPECYGSWKTVYGRLRRWHKPGIWEPIFAALLAETQPRSELLWSHYYIDSTIVRAHHHVAGARKRGITPPPAGSS